jgi:hypothetical protein
MDSVKPPETIPCPYCGGHATKQSSTKVYSKDYGPFYLCTNYPQCDAHVGIHKTGPLAGHPFGTLANKKLREARHRLHATFDPVWKESGLSRHQAYSCLAYMLKLDPKSTHIGSFDITRCQLGLETVIQWKNQRAQAPIPFFTYGGVGARGTPPSVIQRMISVGKQLALLGGTLRSGAADGADTAFETGCHLAWGGHEIFLPWRNFNKHPSQHYTVTPKAFELAKIHPRYEALSQGVKKLMGRNSQILMGPTMDTPVDSLLAWTPKGRVVGGTGHTILLAQQLNIPVINLSDSTWKEELNALLTKLSGPASSGSTYIR